MNEKKVIIFSPSIYSFYTICVLKLMLQKKINIDSIIILNLFNKQRFKNEFGRDGRRLLKKIWMFSKAKILNFYFISLVGTPCTLHPSIF